MARSIHRKRPPVVGPLVARPSLMLAIATGLLVWAACRLAPYGPNSLISAILAWDAVCLVFFVATLRRMWGADAARIRVVAEGQDEGQGVILALILAAVAASIGVVAAELSAAKIDQGVARAVRIALVFATVAASWFMVQLVFALHYAHEYYGRSDSGETDPRGLLFPGGEPPDYWDFVHFSVIIGVACQTADIAFTSQRLRRLGTVHGVVAFVFNTVVLALTINLLAGLF
ncbi:MULTISPECIES: DUF1345 domain-containing protein [Phenylobacterium]|uniref:Membrane protein n=1 Tax=Phenylobacterium koreense TaxID=266125 RepID=A0ABV2EFZ9_9CAUL